MSIDDQNTASDLEVKVQRKNINNNKLDYFLPDPISDTKEEYLIKDSTAIFTLPNSDLNSDIIAEKIKHFQNIDNKKLR